jgi:hypothetical protein
MVRPALLYYLPHYRRVPSYPVVTVFFSVQQTDCLLAGQGTIVPCL